MDRQSNHAGPFYFVLLARNMHGTGSPIEINILIKTHLKNKACIQLMVLVASIKMHMLRFEREAHCRVDHAPETCPPV
jgi:hypothetical protein